MHRGPYGSLSPSATAATATAGLPLQLRGCSLIPENTVAAAAASQSSDSSSYCYSQRLEGLSLCAAETCDGRAHSCCSWCVESVSASCNNLLAARAAPDAYARPLHSIAPAEDAGVLAVLRDFDLLDHLTQGGTVTGAVFPTDSYLLSTLTLHSEKSKQAM
jgi:hypothetical protein